MKQARKDQREEEIAEAAYAILAEKGFGGMSMLAVAKRAKASNETLYRWYGDKTGLFRALIERNAARVADRLDTSLAADETAEASLAAIGPVLLEMLLSPRAIALNQAAAAEPGQTLGAVLAEAGRGTVFPRLVALMTRLQAQKPLADPPATAAALWVDLLVGDWQIRCVTGAMSPPDAGRRAERAARADALFHALQARKT